MIGACTSRSNLNLTSWRPSRNGWWFARAAALGGVRLPPDTLRGLTMLLFNRTLYLGADAGILDIDHREHPARIDILIVRGPNRWRFIPGIFQHGSELRLCLDLSGATRPSAFATPFGSRLFLVTYERAPLPLEGLLGADHLRRVDADGLQGRQQAADHRHHDHERNGGAKARDVRWTHAGEQCLERSSSGDC